MTEPLDAATLPLWGSRLIEASAGTGKTWTIAALVLRLVLGHGGENGHGRALMPGEILVMTFTRAATRELSERIRTRLVEAARCFRGEAEPAADDALLQRLLHDHPAGSARSAAAWRLALAAEGMDEAAVHTIDAWCQRMLREHAFDSGCLFDEELAPDERLLQAEAARDYWRQQVYVLPADALARVLAVWRDVDALVDDVQRLADVELPAVADETLAACIERLVADSDAGMQRLKAGWAERAVALQAWLDARYDGKDFPFEKKKLTQKNYRQWLGALGTWAADPQAETLALGAGAQRLTPAGLAEVRRPGVEVDLPADFAALAQLLQALATRPSPQAALRLHAAAAVQRRLAALKQQAGRYGFADMLQRLDRALDPLRSGDAATRLRGTILTQYPVALIDEFQDTSPLQARIFDRLYHIAGNHRATALLLIGDPKQSIYGFRGADIHSYLAVRRATAGRHHVLGTNHRSTQGLVTAVNHLFGHAEARPGAGAFMFSDGAAETLPFLAVAARGRDEVCRDAHGELPALTLSLDTTLHDAPEHLRLQAERCAERIAVLLDDEQAGFAAPAGTWRRLRPGDIAVLVRTGREAAAVRAALRRRQVASVYLSDRDSVFASPEAADLLRLLQAVAAPNDTRLVRAALASATVGLPLADLARLADDDEAFDAQAEILRGLQPVWREQGVLAMLRQAFHRLQLPARWLGGGGDDGGGGERRLTNLLHLAELLQQASATLDGERSLLHWLAAQRQADGGDDERIVRLESDADLVQVVTVHKSKGLEYPLVFLPWACSHRAVDAPGRAPPWQVDDQGRRHLQLAPDKAALAAADRERQREDLRLLYVALTRARHALWVGAAAPKAAQGGACTAHRSAFGYLVGGAAALDAAAFGQAVGDAARGCAHIVVEPAAETPGQTRPRPRAPLPPLRVVEPYAASFDRHWSLASYSALVRAIAGPLEAAAARDDEAPAGSDGAAAGAALPATASGDGMPAPVADVAPAAAAAGAAASWHGLPRGAAAGQFLHDQLEWLAGEGFALVGTPALRLALRQRIERQGWGARAAALHDWLAAIATTPLPPLGVPLAALATIRPEMEFWFRSDGLSAAAVDALCRRHLLPGRDRPALPARELHGMLMGFADLVFEHDGRWWVLDYKSNALGDVAADYTADALAAAMATHRYDVQAALYLLALHRLLRLRLGAGYDPARQLGGAIYWFVRGLDGPACGCHVVPAVPALLHALEALVPAAAGWP